MDDRFNQNKWISSFDEAEVSEPNVPYGTPGRRNAVVEETFELASRVMDYSERLVKVNMVFADQILRSGTSVGSHVREAQGAQSLKAFINKMKVAHQELEETDYRLDLCHLKSHYPHDQDLVRRTKALFPLFNAILNSSNEPMKRERAERKRAAGRQG